MSEHLAKTAALLAYELDLLSPAGRARVDRHLGSCALCAQELRAIRAYELLATEAREQQWREPDWDRMDLALRREAKDVVAASRRQRRALYGGLALAAAILLTAAGSMFWPHTAVHQSPPSGPDTLALRDGAPRDGTVTAIAGHATIDGRALMLGDVIAEDARLVTSPGSAAHVRLADGTGFVLAADTTARLDRSRERATVITLDTGSVTSRVAHLEREARYEVIAAPYVIHVRGTHFSVSRDATSRVTVGVSEGVVEVTRGSTSVARVVAPGRWSAPESDDATPAALVEPAALGAGAATWPVVQIPRVEGVERVDFDGVALPLAGTIAMRASVGSHEGLAYGLTGVPVRFTLDVGPEGASLDPTLMIAPPPTDEPRRGTLDPAVVRDVVTRGMDGVQRCYRTALMRQPNLAGRMALRITVDPGGRVSRAALNVGATPYPWLSTCVENQASAWSFPAPSGGGPVSFNVPLDFNAD
jgi:ferric-dicitrate binding protein FerR (iron transport regulator)